MALYYRLPAWLNFLDSSPRKALTPVSRWRYCERDWVCIICQEDHKPEDPVLTTCGHLFGKECITHWLHIRRICPLCQREVQLDQDQVPPGLSVIIEINADGSLAVQLTANDALPNVPIHLHRVAPNLLKIRIFLFVYGSAIMALAVAFLLQSLVMNN